MERFPKKVVTPEDQLPAEGNAAGPPLQFNLRSLLVLQAAVAVLLALLLTINVFGVVIVFVATVIAMTRKIDPRHERARRLIVDLLAGVLLPVLCLIYDPIVLRGGSSISTFAFVAIVSQIILLVVWQIVSLWPVRWWGNYFGGALSVGCMMAALIGIMLLPASILGLLVAIGLVGFTPFLTAYVFLRNSRSATKAATPRDTKFSPLMHLLGAAIAVAVPYVVWVLAGDELSRLIQALPVPSSWLSQYGF